MTKVDRNALKGALMILIIFIIVWVICENRDPGLEDEQAVTEASMQPSQSGSPYKRAGMVAVNSENHEHMSTGRIIAMEGDVVKRIDNIIYINEHPLTTPGWLQDNQVSDGQWESLGRQLDLYGNSVPENHVVVMSDNTSRGNESVDFTMLPLNEVAGLMNE